MAGEREPWDDVADELERRLDGRLRAVWRAVSGLRTLVAVLYLMVGAAAAAAVALLL